MHRVFTLTLTGSYQSLYALILAVTGAVPTDGLLPAKCCALELRAAAANSTTPVLISDRNSTNSTGTELLPGVPYKLMFDADVIWLGDFTLKGNTLVVTADIIWF